LLNRIKISALVILLFLSVNFNYAQTNVVYNGSLEILDSCPTNQDQLNKAVGWFKPTIGTSDLFAQCYSDPDDTNYYTPDNFIGYQTPFDGENYAGIYCYFPSLSNSREYLGISLIDSLASNKKYSISFYFSCADSSKYGVSKIGILIETDSLYIPTNNLLSIQPTFWIDDSILLFNKLQWNLFNFEYISTGGEKYLYIGNFHNDSASNVYSFNDGAQWNSAYYYIDDVSITEIIDSTDTVQPIDSTIFEINIFPNPNNGEFVLNYNLNTFSDGVFRIYNTIGQIVFEEKLIQNNGIRNLQMNLSSGVYLWQVESGEVILKREKMIIVK